MKLPKIKIGDEFKITVLVCFLLDKIGELPTELIAEILTKDDFILPFKLYDALAVIEKKGLAERANKNGDCYKITEQGRALCAEFKGSVPAAIRDKTLREGQAAVRMAKLKKTAKWKIIEKDGGCAFRVAFLNEMDGSEIMEVKIHTRDYESAAEIERKFLESPAEIIRNTLNNFL